MWPFSRAAQAQTRRQAARPRLAVEALEDRCLLAAAASAAIVADIVPGSSGSNPANLLELNGTLYFAAADAAHGTELWKSDGTAAGTVLVKDINPGPGNSAPQALTTIGSTIYFSADDGSNGRELWKTDGTAAGTVLVKDINKGGLGSNPCDFVTVNGTLFFVAADASERVTAYGPTFLAPTNLELWKTDGTAKGTTMVKNICPAKNSSYPAFLTEFNGALYFRAFDGTHGYELWKSDGTGAGTALVKDIYPGWRGSDPEGLTNLNGRLVFAATDPDFGRELWASDGTDAGTVRLKDIVPGPRGSGPASLVNVNGTLFFVATDDRTSNNNNFPYTLNYELYKSDGTAAGTVLVKDINPGDEGSQPDQFINVNGLLYFAAFTPDYGRELWTSDGTTAGTQLVKDIYPGVDGFGQPNDSLVFTQNFGELYGEPTNVNGRLYFTATDGVHGRELWQSDGTAAGTTLVRDILPGAASSQPAFLVAMNNKLYFSADDGVHGRELWDPPPVPATPNDPLFAVSSVPQLSINDVSRQEGNNGVARFTFTVTLSSPSTLPVTVSYATASDPAAWDCFDVFARITRKRAAR